MKFRFVTVQLGHGDGPYRDRFKKWARTPDTEASERNTRNEPRVPQAGPREPPKDRPAADEKRRPVQKEYASRTAKKRTALAKTEEGRDIGRLRKRQIIPEGTFIRATLTDPKIVHGNFGRQVELMTNVTEGGEENEYKGTKFKTWFSFRQDKETKEEYVAYGGPLYELLSMVAPNLDEVLEDENLSNADYEKFLKKTVRKLDDLEIVARVGVKTKKGDENKPPEQAKRNNFLAPGTFGPEEDFADIDMGDESAA